MGGGRGRNRQSRNACCVRFAHSNLKTRYYFAEQGSDLLKVTSWYPRFILSNTVHPRNEWVRVVRERAAQVGSWDVCREVGAPPEREPLPSLCQWRQSLKSLRQWRERGLGCSTRPVPTRHTCDLGNCLTPLHPGFLLNRREIRIHPSKSH